MPLQPLTVQRGAVPIALDRPRILFFSMAATWLLVQEYGIDFASELYTVVVAKSLKPEASEEPTEGETLAAPVDLELRLKSVDALAFFLWAGLQEELAGTGETLSLDQAREFIRPWLLKEIFNKLILALTGAVSTPADPVGKAAAAGTTPKPSAKKKKASILKTRSGLRLAR